jgi:hypothetical protein
MREFEAFGDGDLLAGYVHEASWFWFTASTLEMSFAAGWHRLLARCLLDEIRRRGLPEPSAAWVFEYARRRFPRDDFYWQWDPDQGYAFAPTPAPGV